MQETKEMQVRSLGPEDLLEVRATHPRQNKMNGRGRQKETSLLIFLSYPFDVSSLSPEIKAAVHCHLDYVLHKGTGHKRSTSYIVCIMDLYIFYKFLKYSTKVSWSK